VTPYGGFVSNRTKGSGGTGRIRSGGGLRRRGVDGLAWRDYRRYLGLRVLSNEQDVVRSRMKAPVTGLS
jgi:hypothetical protein